MATHIIMAKYTDRAITGLVAKPEDREAEVKKLFEAAGAKLVSYYMTTGEFDFIITVQGKIQDILSVVMVAAAGGGVTNIKTIEAFTPAEFKSALAKAKGLAASFRSAGT